MTSRTIAGVVIDTEEYEPGKFRRIAGGEGERFTLETLPPNVIAFTPTPGTPLPAGATVAGTVEMKSEWLAGAFDVNNLKTIATIGEAAEKAGVLQTGFPWKNMMAAIGTGSAVGGFFGPVGAGVGAAVAAIVSVVGFFTDGRNRATHGGVYMGPGVQAWKKVLMPQSFYDWLVSTQQLAVFENLRDVQKAFLAWTVTEWGFILIPEERSYSGIANTTYFDAQFWSTATWEQAYPHSDPSNADAQWKRNESGIPMPQWGKDMYTQLGIDYEASAKLRRQQIAGNKRKAGFVYLKEALAVKKGEGVGGPETESSSSGMMVAAGIALLLLSNK